MVVEDDLRVLAMVRQYLQTEGFEVWEAQDAQEAWRMLLEKPPDAAVIDLTLRSERDGWGLVGSIRQDTRFSRMPVVIMSGQAAGEVVPRTEELRCSYVAKPFEPDVLVREVREAMRQALRPVQVSLILPSCTVEGTVHVPSEQTRFSDAWETALRDDRLFLPLTDATVRTMEGTETEAEFLEVRKAEIQAVLPLDGD